MKPIDKLKGVDFRIKEEWKDLEIYLQLYLGCKDAKVSNNTFYLYDDNDNVYCMFKNDFLNAVHLGKFRSIEVDGENVAYITGVFKIRKLGKNLGIYLKWSETETIKNIDFADIVCKNRPIPFEV